MRRPHAPSRTLPSLQELTEPYRVVFRHIRGDVSRQLRPQRVRSWYHHVCMVESGTVLGHLNQTQF
jgi:hypothetical protein